MLRAACLLALLTACAGDDPVDTAPEEQVQDEPEPCAEVELDVEGPQPPVVGDEWTVWLRCDGSTLIGTTVVRFDPADFGTVDANVVTFLRAGTATLRVQVGAYREETEVTVTEP